MGKRTGKGIVALAFLAAAVAAFSGASFAAGLAPASVEYSADRHVTTGSGEAMTGKVHAAPGKERNEFGAGAVSIMRMDKKVMWTLMPDQKKYMEHKFGESTAKRDPGNIQDCDVKQTAAGEETLDGFRTRKSTIEVSCPGKEKFGGTMWITKENIVMRMETDVKTSGAKKEKFRMELKNLKIGKQDPALFEIPKGYEKFEVPSIGNIQQMFRDQAAKDEQRRREQEEAKAREREEAAAKARETGRSYSAQPREQTPLESGVDKAKKLKNLLGW
ncbi:MAG: DUF4412 domain-containing protein [Thermodesulfobacteriota bacterium]